MQKLRCILLVEDDPNDAELTIMTLESNKLSNGIVHVRDGEEALNYLNRQGPFADRKGEDPALVILDLKLPKVSGLEVLSEMRKADKLKLMPVVIFTSSQEEQDVVDGYNLGTNGYVVKPVDFHQFIEAVKQTGVFWGIINEPPRNGGC
ncbi:MAG: response regulator [Dissulfurispiraceae bacterium]